MAKHNGWEVGGKRGRHAPGSAGRMRPVRYSSKSSAKNVARQVKGAKVSKAGGGCLIAIICGAVLFVLLPLVDLGTRIGGMA